MATMALAGASSAVACAAPNARQLTPSRSSSTSAGARAFGPLSARELSSLSSPWSSDELSRACSRGSVVVQKVGQNGASSSDRGGRRESRVVTMALPVDAYWITAAQAVTVAGLMGGIAVVTGIIMNIKIEIQALEEFKELEAKGLLPEEIVVPDEDFDLESPLFIFQNRELSSSKSPRNRPVREELQPEPETELTTELEIARKEQEWSGL